MAKDKTINEQIRAVMDNLLAPELPKVLTMALLFLYAPFVAVLQLLIALGSAFLRRTFRLTVTCTNTHSVLVLATLHTVLTHLSFDIWHWR
jgi:hypothetical protein